MITFARLFFALLASALVFTACTHPPQTAQPNAPNTKPEGARLSTEEAVRIAKRTAEQQGVRLRDYKEPEVHYEFTRKDKSWWVFFDGRVPMPGNHFAVSIDDQTGGARLIPGR